MWWFPYVYPRLNKSNGKQTEKILKLYLNQYILIKNIWLFDHVTRFCMSIAKRYKENKCLR